MTPLYKIVLPDGSPCHGGSGAWPMPGRNPDGTWIPGEWRALAKGEKIDPCAVGLHLCRVQDLPQWPSEGAVVCVADTGRSQIVVADDKVVVRRARLLSVVGTLDARTLRLFACDCAERALLREREHGREPDPRSWAAIEVSRRFANGEATDTERAAAWDAARAAAWDAAWDAERLWQGGHLLEMLRRSS